MKSGWRWFAFAIVSILIFSQFQNCGRAGFNGKGLGSSAVSGLDQAKITPFAYDPAVDTISYDSCFGQNTLNLGAHFAIKAGAYEKGGIGLTSSYMDYTVGTNLKPGVLKPEYPDSVVTVEQLKRFTAASDTNKGAMVQMAVRSKSSPDSLLATSDGSAVEGNDFVSVMGSLTDDMWMHSIFSLNNERTRLSEPNRHFPLAEVGFDLLEGALRFHANESAAAAVRDFMASRGFLFSLTFTSSGSAEEGIGEPFESRKSANHKAYGRGYKFNFSTMGSMPEAQRPKFHTGQTPKPNVPPNFLASVQEFDLQNPASQLATTWDCPGELKLLVVDEAHLAINPDLCPEMDLTAGAEALTSTDLSYLNIVRRHLRPNEWRVNIKRGCAVPLGGDLNRCYSEDDGSQADTQYSADADCYSYVNRDLSLSRVCANYVSMCVRLN